jgi:hypothetical protein
MSNKQQTAVEWIEYQVQQQGITHYFSLRELLEQAKEMEKEQMIDAYWHVNKDDIHFDDLREEDDGEIWYNETYGGNK